MADKLTAEFARRQIAGARADMARETERVAEAARHIHADAQAGRDVTGDLERLIQYATSALHRAARLRGAEETAAYLTATEEAPR
ncbi:hypothetical protein ACFV1L_10535 [Kitasatospora sp. NPDC059646]|uniref:hypothetical protein n=1 Tax=Kitasatospora sp. NPDC059646 TaxID=3346893 RepID=UPI0036B69D76